MVVEIAIALLLFIVTLVLLKIWGSSPAAPVSTGANPRPLQESLPKRVQQPSSSFVKIVDKYDTIEQVQDALRKSGLEASNLIIGIDYTRSNDFNGKHTFEGYSLHDTSRPTFPNPYQQVISILGRTLEPFDEDGYIPVYGFGDITTKGHSVFPFYPNGTPCIGIPAVLSRYTEITPKVRFSGPTSFAPLIREAIKIVSKSKEYHILVIIADGLVTCPADTSEAIVEASEFPLSILVIGVGDGNDSWQRMIEFDDGLPARKFDNFQFVPFHEVLKAKNPEAAFAITALQEIPDQYRQICELGLLG